MTENSRKVLETLKAHYAEGKQWETAELAQAAGVTSPTVTGAVTGMCKKGYAEKIFNIIQRVLRHKKNLKTLFKN